MLLKNDKIVLKKDFGGLKKGTIFQVSEIFKDGTISFKNDSVGVGVVSFGEYEKLFEKCVKEETLKNLTKDDEIVIGQRVKVRKDLVDGIEYGSDYYVKDMGYLGEYITISEIVKFSDCIKYRAKETSRFLWTKQMFDM